MNLEQRLAAVEKDLAAMKAQKNTAEELSVAMGEIVREAIKNEQRPGGILHKSGLIEKAAIDSAASRATYHLKAGINVRS